MNALYTQRTRIRLHYVIHTELQNTNNYHQSSERTRGPDLGSTKAAPRIDFQN